MEGKTCHYLFHVFLEVAVFGLPPVSGGSVSQSVVEHIINKGATIIQSRSLTLVLRPIIIYLPSVEDQ